MAQIRPREGEDGPAAPPNNAAAAAAPAAAANNNTGEAQSIVERADKQLIVKNSPYGMHRAALGWGDLFKKAVICYDHVNHPNFHVGVSSLNPVPSKQREMAALMPLYQRKFHTLEHCNPYYNMGDPDTWLKWKSMGSKEFKFTVKASQWLTHGKNLAVDHETQAHVPKFFSERVLLLGEKLGAVLLQLPPQFKCTPEHLARIPQLAALIPGEIKIAIEFRNNSWFNDEVYKVLKQCKWALVATHTHEAGDSPIVDDVNITAGLFYARLHGAVGENTGDYGRVVMARWAAAARRFLEQRPDGEVYIFLNNNDSHVNGLTSSIVDATALAQEFLAGGKIVPRQQPAAAAAAQLLGGGGAGGEANPIEL